MNFSIISAECELACLDIRREYEILVIILQYMRRRGTAAAAGHNKIFPAMFRKHFPLPWTAIWPMTKNSTGTWESSQSRVERNLREVMSAPGNLLYWLDLSFWSSFYFISSQPATWILIFSPEQFFLLWKFLIEFQSLWLREVQLVSSSAGQCWCPTLHLTSFTPPGWAESRVTHATLPCPALAHSEIFRLGPTMPIATKQDIFNETRFIFVTDITTSHQLQLECQPQVSQLRVWLQY